MFFNFNILALVVSEILGGPKFMLGSPVPPVRPLVKINSDLATIITAIRQQDLILIHAGLRSHIPLCLRCSVSVFIVLLYVCVYLCVILCHILCV